MYSTTAVGLHARFTEKICNAAFKAQSDNFVPKF